jgi:hypothetical protein
MTKEDGTLRSFYDFQKEAKAIIGDYNVRYLQTEYNTVVRSARSAANWKKFEENADLFPNLEFMESRATNKRPEHLHYVGTIRPINDPFWDTHTPPISWGCQCWLRSTKAEISNLPSTEPLNPVFENNPGKTAEPFNIDKTAYAQRAEKKGITRQDAAEFVQQESINNTKAALVWAKANLKGKVIQHKRLNNVQITTRGLKEWTNQPHDQRYLKNELLRDIEDIFNNSTYVGTTLPKIKDEIQGHIFEIQINGYKSWIIVKEFANGMKVLYSISDNASILDYIKSKT